MLQSALQKEEKGKREMETEKMIYKTWGKSLILKYLGLLVNSAYVITTS